MRTDAKIGFAIGGVLLAVLAVYLIVVPKHNSKKTVALAPAGDVSTENASAVTASPALPAPPLNAANDALPALPSPVVAVAPAPAPAPAADDHAKPLITDAHGPVIDGTFHPGGPLKATDTNDLGSDSPFIRNATGVAANDATPAVAMDDHLKSDSHVGRRHASSHRDSAVSADRTVASTTRQYTIQSGQTLSSIASDVYGNARFWVAIQRENTGLDAKHLKVGQKINLPDIADVRPAAVLVDVIEPISTVGGTEVEPTVHTYRVQAGDSLYKIAKKLYGSGRQTSAIYALNKDLIGDDESKLKRGMLLKLPDRPTRIAVSSLVQ